MRILDPPLACSGAVGKRVGGVQECWVKGIIVQGGAAKWVACMCSGSIVLELRYVAWCGYSYSYVL